MPSKVQFKSDALEAIHASASALRKVGAIDKATMRSFDETCLSAPVASSPNRSLTQSQSREPTGVYPQSKPSEGTVE